MINVKQAEEELPPVSPKCQYVKQDNQFITIRHNKITELLRKSTSTQLKCSMFCGGRKCKYETGSVWDKKDKAIEVIFSHWVTDDILAISRPNSEMIKHFDLIGLFKKENIQTIINLQEPGEHANCGPPLEESSGFSYDPNTFMDNNIYFYNFHWKDFSDVSLDSLMDMVKVITFALLQGKVAVHCHAGLGRTGTLIAAYLIYTYRCQAHNAIKFVRSRRPNSIQSRSQISILFKFANYISPCFIVYNQVSSSFPVKTNLKEFLQRQNLLLHGKELRILRYIPKIVFIICEKLINLSTPFNDHLEKNEFENFTINYISFKGFKQNKDLINKKMQPTDLTSKTDYYESQFSKQIEISNIEDEHLIDSLVDGQSSSHQSDSIDNSLNDQKSLEQHRASFIFENNSLLLEPIRDKVTKSIIIQTLIDQPKCEPELINKIYDYQKEINNKPSGWNRLRDESDIDMLCALLISWLENFHIPILNDQILYKIIDSKGNFLNCFHELNQETRYTIEYLIRFILKLSVNQKDLKERLVMRMISSLTMKKIKLNYNEEMPQMKPNWNFLNDSDIIIDFFNELIKAISLSTKKIQ